MGHLPGQDLVQLSSDASGAGWPAEEEEYCRSQVVPRWRCCGRTSVCRRLPASLGISAQLLVPPVSLAVHLSIESLVQGGPGTGEGMSPRDPMADRTWDPSQGAEGVLLFPSGVFLHGGAVTCSSDGGVSVRAHPCRTAQALRCAPAPVRRLPDAADASYGPQGGGGVS